MPGVVTAGTFITDHEKIFYDITSDENCIVVELIDENYQKLFVEVDDVETALQILTEK